MSRYHTGCESSKLTLASLWHSIHLMRLSKEFIKPVSRSGYIGSRRRNRRIESFKIALVAVVVLSFALLAGCGGKPFNVKPRPDVPQTPVTAGARAESNGVTILAEAVTDEDFLYETFDANLILAGVLPVRVKMTNSGEDAVDLRRARFQVIDARGRRFKSADSKRAFKQVFSYYGISIYSKPGYKESRQNFSSYALDLINPLGSGESRQGMIFFRVPSETARDARLTFSVQRLDARRSKSDSAIEIKLN